MIRLVLLLLVALTAQAQFRQALPGYEFEFPRDHFAHAEFELEWWYYTGNLSTADGRRFGFELTFFRNAVERDQLVTSVWDVDQLYLAHFAISDVEGRRFFKAERLNRAGPGLAGADLDRALIWNGNWQVAWRDGVQLLRAISKDAALELDLRPAKPPVINGEDGVSQKADGTGKASHYITFTRLNAIGSLQLDGEVFSLEGAAWMDHEFSTNSMGDDQAGWDWLSLQFDDSAELMLYRLRDADGLADAHSAGTYVGADGATVHLKAADFTMTPGARWTSPATGGIYPLEWRVEVPKLSLDLTVSTPLQAQEMVPTNGRGPTYWEGAIEVEGGGLRGVGYLEMTGYAERLQLGVERQSR
ncbi:MAG: carotenoid 1,2-hydratase [Acidobacteria bacterium]|nr:carotenoid 1,2-hydratase [Acidobacteriota bacterium]MDA1236405.1 carotenoid 1,2-hydratase [Acidobacteriota bacterium]